MALFYSAAFFFTNAIICARAAVGRPQASMDPNRVKVQKALDKAVVRHFLRKGYKELKTVSPKIITETDRPGRGKLVKFEPTDQMTLKQAINFMRLYPVVYEQEPYPTEFEMPIGEQIEKFKLTNKPDGTFSLEAVREGGIVEVDTSYLQKAVEILSDPKLKLPLKETIRDAFLNALDERLSSQPDFKIELQTRDPKGTVTSKEREKAFRAGRELLVAIAMKRSTLEGNLPEWLQKIKEDISSKMQEVREKQNNEIANEEETKLKFEFTQSMLKTSKEAVEEWENLKTQKIIFEENEMGTDKKEHLKVTIHETDKVSLREIFKLLQFYPELYKSQGGKHTRFEVQIGGKARKFRLSKALFGKNQILVSTANDDWPGTTKRGTGNLWAPDYDTMVDKVLAKVEHEKLAKAMLNAVDSKLNSQPDFSADLEIPGETTKSADTVRATVEFMIISMVAEAAQPTDEFKDTFFTELEETIEKQKVFPESKDMPKLADFKRKAGRSPAMDSVVEGMLKNVGSSSKMKDVFSEENFPVRKKNGGTQEGRKLIHAKGSELVPSYLIRQRCAEEHDLSLLDNIVEEECTRRRRKRNACLLKNRNSATIDEKSIKITEDRVEFDVVDRRDAKQRQHVQLKISPEELATPKLIKDNLSNSRRAGKSETYAKINKGLAVHGLIFSVLAAGRYFEEGENFRGAMTVAQSAHTLAGITGVNEIASKVGQRVLSSAAKGLAKGLNLEKGLERLSTKVERFAERGVGQLLGAVPGVGLAFDIYFIEQDIEELANLDLNNPEDLKLLPLRVIDLALDVSTTVLNLVGTFCPLAEVVTEPLVIVLSIIRMAIDDFYIDIMAEIEKIN